MRPVLLAATIVLGACATCPAPAAYPVVPDARQAQTTADARCARSGKVAVLTQPAECTSEQCVTRFECR